MGLQVKYWPIRPTLAGLHDDLTQLTATDVRGGYTLGMQVQRFAFQVDSPASAMHIFLDGQLFAEGPNTDTFKPRNVAFLIGPAHLGLLGEVRFWNYVRTPAEVQADRPRVLASSRPGLLGCWRLGDSLLAGGRSQDYSQLRPPRCAQPSLTAGLK